MTVLCSICSKHNLIPEGPLLSTLKFITEIKDTNNSSAKKYVSKISLRRLLQGRWLHGYGVSLRTKINLKKRSDLPGEINSDIKNMCSNKQNATLKQKIMVQDNKEMWF